MRPIVMCRNPKFSKLVMDCNLAAMAMRYPNDYVNEQYRDLRQEQIKKALGAEKWYEKRAEHIINHV